MAEYGQFGQAVYNQDAKEWYFERNLNASELRQIGSSKVILPPATSLSNEERQYGSRQRDNQVRSLVQSYPELQPAASLLADFARVSQAVEDAATRHDPMKETLLAFGRIPDAKGDNSVDVAAFAAGPTGSEVRVVRLRKRMHALDDSNSLEVPSMTDEGATWKGPGVPIQSIEFTQPITGSRGSILAVRLIKEIVLFQPRISKATQANSSTIELNQILRFSIDEAASLPFAHIAFNPWNAQQFAVIDQAGSWTLWELGEGKFRTAPALVYRNDLADATENGVRPSIDDGWGRISWITAPTILVVCDRRKVVVHDYESSSTKELPAIATVLDDSVGWNLDIAIAPSYPNHVILLTTSHVVVYRIVQGEESILNASCVMCTRHFRSGSDLSSGLHVCQDENEVVIFIRSDLTPTVIYYRLDTSTPDSMTCSDPMQLTMASILAVQTVDNCVIDMHVRSLAERLSLDSLFKTSPPHEPSRKDTRLYSITTLHRDMSLLETLYVSGPGEVLSLLEHGSGSMATLTNSARSLDGITNGDGNSRGAQQRRAKPAIKSSDDWTVNYELTMRQLKKALSPVVSDVDDFFEAVLAELISAHADGCVPNETLQEQFTSEAELDDIDAVTNALNSLQRSLKINEEQREEVFDDSAGLGPPLLRPVDWPPTLRGVNFLDLAPLHLSIVDNWIAPLQGVVPEAVRVIQEQHALRVATEVGLSRVIIRPEQPKDRSAYPLSQSEDFKPSIQALNVSESSRATPSLYFDASSQPQSSVRATPSSPGTPSTTASRDQPAVVTSLSRYTTFSNPPSSALPRSLNRVLSHWTLGADPAEYDWRSTTRRIDRQVQEEADEELTERDRIRQQKRRERHERRQQRHEEERQRQDRIHSQAPEIMESQPTQGSTSYGFSQTTAGSQMPASQIMPGRYGGRPPPKKKRKSGF